MAIHIIRYARASSELTTQEDKNELVSTFLWDSRNVSEQTHYSHWEDWISQRGSVCLSACWCFTGTRLKQGNLRVQIWQWNNATVRFLHTTLFRLGVFTNSHHIRRRLIFHWHEGLTFIKYHGLTCHNHQILRNQSHQQTPKPITTADYKLVKKMRYSTKSQHRAQTYMYSRCTVQYVWGARR